MKNKKAIINNIDYQNTGSLKIFAVHYKNHMGLFLMDMICALAVSAVDLIFPWLSKGAMEKYLPGGFFKPFFLVMVIMVAAYIIRAILYYIITYWGHRMGVYMEADMRTELYDHIEKLSFNFFDKNRTGQLMSRVTNDLFEIAELAHHGPEDILISVVTIVGAFIILLTIEWRLALIVFAVIPVFVVFTIILRGKMAKANAKVKAKMGEINASIESGFSGIKTAKAFANEELELKKFEETNSRYVDSKRDFYQAMAIFHGGMEFALSILSVIIIMAGGYYIMSGSMNYVELVTFSLYISTFITPIRKLVQFVEQYMAGMAGFRRFVELMRTEPEITDAEDAIDLEGVKGEICFNDVGFQYKAKEETKDISGFEGALSTAAHESTHARKRFDGKKQRQAKAEIGELLKEGAPAVLHDVNIRVPAGKSLAVVGSSGGGKTTLCNLIPRFYDVTEGSVTVDGYDIRKVTQYSLRKAIGIVQQDVFIFAGTISENIAYGKPGATKEEIVEAAKRAELHEEIMALKDGYDTYVGERGAMLSGGQKQRVGIARLFLKNPPIIILDEATSALDSITEINIQNAFDELAAGRTSVIIAHRLSTIRNADIIAVIEDHQVSEMGSHEELMNLNGRYAGMVNAQKI